MNFYRRQMLQLPLVSFALCVTTTRPARALDFFWFKEPTWPLIFQKIEADYPNTPSLTTSELAAQLAAGEKPLLVDVRTKAEFAVSHLEGAIHVPDFDAAVHLNQWRALPKVVFYCSVGLRSAQVVQKARTAGLSQAFNLSGSLFQWANEGRSLRRGQAPAAFVHPYNKRWGSLLQPQLRAAID
jgi:rhodanese-related sulfurtransferase